ncbi:MAG: hypothetical protein NT061_07545 [Spirochaetes bacterium]|nr:hypothetical protein [Spirochaetota bacterium]
MKSLASYADQQEKKRGFISFGMTMGLYGFIFGMSLLYGIIRPQEQIFSNMTVIVNLPGPVAPEPGQGSLHPSEVGEESPNPQPAPQTPAKAAEAPKADTTKVASAPAAKAESKPAKQVAPAPQSAAPVKPKDKAYTMSQEPIVQAPASAAVQPPSTQTTVAEPWVPGERGPGSRQESALSSIYVPGQGQVPWTGGVTIHKTEKGSASDTYLGGAQGTVGQIIYVPIYYSLPLPKTIPASIYNAIPDQKTDFGTMQFTAQERRKAVSQYYEFDGTAYMLKIDVPLEQREPLWMILEDGGYNPSNADYRQGNTLNPVVIGFTVTKDRQLKGADILQSSGDPEIDKALLYGFKRGVFFNRSGETVPGRFIYRF